MIGSPTKPSATVLPSSTRSSFHSARSSYERTCPARLPPPGSGSPTRAPPSLFRDELLALAGPDDSYDLRLVVALRTVDEDGHRIVEGSTERFGRIGLVEGNDADDVITLELIATAHETLHAVGALDAYDAAGHAVAPDGFVEPALGYPQRFAEVMVGEVPDEPGAGHVPKTLEEVRVGAVTASQIGWLQ